MGCSSSAKSSSGGKLGKSIISGSVVGFRADIVSDVVESDRFAGTSFSSTALAFVTAATDVSLVTMVTSGAVVCIPVSVVVLTSEVISVLTSRIVDFSVVNL